EGGSREGPGAGVGRAAPQDTGARTLKRETGSETGRQSDSSIEERTMTTMFKRGLMSLCMLSAFGCAAAKPPQELLDARSAYARASAGATPQLNPAELHVAKKALDQAEAAFE